ncbi:hypothetical protein GFS31_36230 [Leptolyngbya sp. BL0902]|uniref:hypothetical protein n=1 Tax=Leptolyngbya sp. BL0902 TaxID=1115757 RepID=UPI0018E81313|nr:hypothetical protein [Leptolyngbya sp. BL0902]QQE66918.1 hypothetical protein GFS31_36230 [Leptolyngbya sp. BL0902]
MAIKTLLKPLRLGRWAILGFLALGLLTALGVVGLGLWVPTWATAPLPPRLVPAILNGNPIHVLYVTRSSDTVLVRCYPGFQPALNLTNQEGFLTCVNSESQAES